MQASEQQLKHFFFKHAIETDDTKGKESCSYRSMF